MNGRYPKQVLFNNGFVKTGLIEAQYSRMLGNAFNVRLDSDYSVDSAPDLKLANDTLHSAEQFVKRSADYLRQEGYL